MFHYTTLILQFVVPVEPFKTRLIHMCVGPKSLMGKLGALFVLKVETCQVSYECNSGFVLFLSEANSNLRMVNNVLYPIFLFEVQINGFTFNIKLATHLCFIFIWLR